MHIDDSFMTLDQIEFDQLAHQAGVGEISVQITFYSIYWYLIDVNVDIIEVLLGQLGMLRRTLGQRGTLKGA